MNGIELNENVWRTYTVKRENEKRKNNNEFGLIKRDNIVEGKGQDVPPTTIKPHLSIKRQQLSNGNAPMSNFTSPTPKDPIPHPQRN